jgi:serine/threonine-protein kinase HipA
MTPREPAASTLDIYLGDVLAGTLDVVEGDQLDFSFDESYPALPVRPVLGQHFEDDLRARYRRRMPLPFFSNLLPEGRLRDLVCSTHRVRRQDDVRLLAVLGEDLPGAVRAVPRGALEHDTEDVRPASPGLRFSLAGVQLKFSMRREGEGLTVPVRGRGDWIVKLPDPRYEQVPENEFSMLTWARAAGIDVPDHELVSVGDLTGLPAEASAVPGLALAVKRFDREPDRRIHIEDFAQVFDLYAEDKYEHVTFEMLAAAIGDITGDVREFIDRLVFSVVIGNADAHLKNWSLRYSDGITANLAPAYDLVSTVQYLPGDQLALNLARSKDFGSVSLESFRRLARKIGRDEADIAAQVESAVARIRDAWPRVESDLPLPGTFKHKLAEHQARVPLLGEV